MMAFITAAVSMFNTNNIGEQYNNENDQWEEEVQQQQYQQKATTTMTSTMTSSSSSNISSSCGTAYSSNNNNSNKQYSSIVWPLAAAVGCAGDEQQQKCRIGQRRNHINDNCRQPQHQQQQMPKMTTTVLSGTTMARRCALVLIVMCAQLSNNAMVAGLTCYETVNGKTTIVQNDAWTYCALVPATIVGNELVNGSQFGLGPDNDMMAAYNTAFAMSADEYRILTVCIYERYDFSRFLTVKPDLAVEFAFRCVCNYDLCNSEPTFSAYLSAIKSESFARR